LLCSAYYTCRWVSLPRVAPAGWCVGGPCKFSRARRLESLIQHTRSNYYRLSRQPLRRSPPPPRIAVAARFLRRALASSPRTDSLSLHLSLLMCARVCLCVCSCYNIIIVISFACQRRLTKSNINILCSR